MITYFVSTIDVRDIREGLESEPSPEKVKNMRMRTTFLVYFIDISFNIMMGLTRELFRQRLKQEKVKQEKTKAEIAMYKSQINPHFMFNTLNTIYGLSITESKNTSDVLLKFTDLMKYMYSYSDKETIPMSEEINYLKQLIDLHSMRLGEQTKVYFKHEVDNLSQMIPPMILITFIENAFKYGVSSSSESEIIIDIKLKNSQLNFTTQNSIFVRNQNHGIGIKNCRQRLDLLYPDAYSLDCLETGKTFETHLKIQL